MLEITVDFTKFIVDTLKRCGVMDFSPFWVAHGSVPFKIINSIQDPHKPAKIAYLRHFAFWIYRLNPTLSATAGVATTAAAHLQAAFPTHTLPEHWQDFVALHDSIYRAIKGKVSRHTSALLYALSPFDSIAIRFLEAVASNDIDDTFPKLTAFEAQIEGECLHPQTYVKNSKEELFNRMCQHEEEIEVLQSEKDALESRLKAQTILPLRDGRTNMCSCHGPPEGKILRLQGQGGATGIQSLGRADTAGSLSDTDGRPMNFLLQCIVHSARIASPTPAPASAARPAAREGILTDKTAAKRLLNEVEVTARVDLEIKKWTQAGMSAIYADLAKAAQARIKKMLEKYALTITAFRAQVLQANSTEDLQPSDDGNTYMRVNHHSLGSYFSALADLDRAVTARLDRLEATMEEFKTFVSVTILAVHVVRNLGHCFLKYEDTTIQLSATVL
ncbi:unnamed protein product [Tilletia caries]|nr:unnamed protein product [Tilletia caries]